MGWSPLGMCAVWCVQSCVKDPHASALWEWLILPHGEAQRGDKVFLCAECKRWWHAQGFMKDWPFFSKTTNCSFLFWDKRNPRVLSYRHLLQRCPNPPCWAGIGNTLRFFVPVWWVPLPQGQTAHLTPVFLPTCLSVFLHLLPPQSGLQELTKQDVTATSVYLLGLRDLRLSIFFIVVHFESSWTLQIRSLAFLSLV